MRVDLKQNVSLFYALVFLFELFRSMFYGMGAVFMLDTLGLMPHHISIIKLFNPLTMTIFEIPTGFIGDKFGRRLNFILSCLCCSIGFFIYASTTTILHAILGEIFYSLGLAFHTGSIDALLISQVLEQKQDTNVGISIPELVSSSQAYRTIGLMIGGTLGIVLSYKSMYLPWLAGGLGFPCVALLALLLDKRVDYTTEKIEWKDTFTNLKAYFKKEEVLWLTVLGIGIMAINIPFFNYWQIFMDRTLGIKIGSMQFIVIYIAYNALMAIGSKSLRAFNKIFGDGKTLAISSIVIGVTTLAMVMFEKPVFAVASFLIGEFARGLYFPSHTHVFNKYVPDSMRSLYMSKLSFFMRAFAVLAYIISAIIAKANPDVNANIYLMSVIGLGFTAISVYFLDKKRYI